MIHRILIFLMTLFSLKLSAQQDFPAMASSKLKEHHEQTLPEKIYLHTDKNFYVTGDILWFKVYNTNATTNQPVSYNTVVYAEILDPSNKPVLQAVINMNQGKNGSFQLPLTLESGNYTIRSYTSWMKNFSPEYFFTKTITIVNPLKSGGIDPASIQGEPVAGFFPEGGNMVAGIPSKIAFKISDPFGKGIDASGYLLEDNDTLLPLNTLVMGMGNFKMTPVAGKQYKAVFTLTDGSSFTKELPAAQPKGFVMNLDEQGDELVFTIRSNDAPDGTEIFLLGHTRQQVKFSQKTNMVQGISVFRFNRNLLGEGISTFTAFAGRQPVAERLYFINPGVDAFVAGLDKESYFPRKKARLTIGKEGIAKTNLSQLSLAVYKIDTLQQRDQVDIVNYLWLTSELKGNIEHPSFYFSSSPLAREAADNLMLTQGWRRFKWTDILSGTPGKQVYSFETGHQTISARVTDPVNNQPVKDISVFLSVPSTKHKLFVSKTDVNGMALFQVKEFYGNEDVIIQTMPADSMYKLELLSPFSDKIAAVPGIPFKGISDVNMLEQYSIAMQASNIYNGNQLNNFIEYPINDTLPFYGKAPYSYNLDDYKRFTTMEEVFREFVREINVGAGSGGLRLKVFNENKREMVEENNLVTIDGVPLFNTHNIFNYDPLKIKKLEVIPGNYVLGNARYNAVAAFYTYPENFEGMQAEGNSVIVNYQGLQREREFYQPVYETDRQILSRIPDFRTTLFWQPEINSTEVEFYTSDTRGKFMVSIQGIDINGKPVAWNQFFEVK